MLEVLSIQYAGALLPFIYYYQEKLEANPEYKHLYKCCTTNYCVFLDFARYMCKHYIFVVNSRDPKLAGKTEFKTKYFEKLLKESFANVFELKTIRKRFIKFCDDYPERVLTKPSMDESSFTEESSHYNYVARQETLKDNINGITDKMLSLDIQKEPEGNNARLKRESLKNAFNRSQDPKTLRNPSKYGKDFKFSYLIS
mmetsp:Transcript_16365/g.14285  ORF Transcript_16365/g.14285 Transcript_16365/m.14285 type:complete len:199 (-) Transcript_16365:1177-1773(-)